MNRGMYFLGRLLLVGIFLGSAFGKIGDFAGTAAYMKSAGMTTATEVFLVGAIILLLLGGLSVLFRFHLKIGVLLLLIFLIPATIIFHNDFGNQIQMIMFLKNISIIGGLLCVSAVDDLID